MPIAARFIGFLWMAIVAALTFVQGVREAFLSAPTLFFERGLGDLCLAIALFATGYSLWQWGRHEGG